MQAETPKPTEGLEYTFIRKPASNPTDRKELANLWELSGSQELSKEIFTTGNILGPEQVDNRDAMGSTSIANLSCSFIVQIIFLSSGSDSCGCYSCGSVTTSTSTAERCHLAAACESKVAR